MDIVFIEQEGKHYYTYADRVYELNNRTFDSLKNKLLLPSKFYFRDCSIAFIKKMSSVLYEEPVNVNVRKVNETCYQAIFERVEKVKQM